MTLTHQPNQIPQGNIETFSNAGLQAHWSSIRSQSEITKEYEWK
jgi:hypothetical protein